MTYATYILLAAKAVKVPGALLLAICMQETGLNNAMVPHDGHSPTYGICQVKLETAQMIGYKGTAKQLMIPQENAKWAAKYLRYQLDRYDNDWCQAVAAYNAGTFNESKISPGFPRNLKYVRNVQKKLDEPFQDKIACGEEVAQK